MLVSVSSGHIHASYGVIRYDSPLLSLGNGCLEDSKKILPLNLPDSSQFTFEAAFARRHRKRQYQADL
jgi:hypothetical protein